MGPGSGTEFSLIRNGWHRPRVRAALPRQLAAVAPPAAAVLLSVCAIVAAAVQLESITGRWLPLAVVAGISIAAWTLRTCRAASYRPIRNAHWEPATVVAPTFGESPGTLGRVVGSWLAAGAAEVILVVSDREVLEQVLDALEHDSRLRVVPTAEPSKRTAIAIGVRAATHSIVVLADSDTSWEPDALRHLVMPFADRAVGGVGTRHRVADADSSLWRRAADRMLEWEFGSQLPAMARGGGVATLKGRTVAYRREALLDVLPELLEETFLGRRCVAGDDGRLTWMLLKRGYKTTHQDTAVVWTKMPPDAKGFVMQRVRWGRNSYRCYLRAMVRGWVFRQPPATQLTVLQKVLYPLSVTLGMTFTVMAAAGGDPLAAVAWGCWTSCGRGVQLADHLRARPRRIRELAAMAGIFVFLMAAIKYYAFFTMRRQEWMTRGRVAGEGQAGELSAATPAWRVSDAPAEASR